MSEEQLKAFLEKVKGDTSLQEKLKAAADVVDTVVALAKEIGCLFSADYFKSEIEDAELEAAAGGLTGCDHIQCDRFSLRTKDAIWDSNC